MVQIITNNSWGWGGGNLDKYVANVPYEEWEWEERAIAWDAVYAKVSAMDETINTKQDALTAWENIKISSNVISADNVFIITEDIVTVSTDATKWVAPYNTSYWYTNIDIDANAGIEWREWAIYTFVVNTEMVVAGTYRNVRVKIWNWAYIPVMWTTAVIVWNSYFIKTQIRQYQYSTKYKSWWALHLFSDTNTTYSAMSVAEYNTGTCTTGRTLSASILKQIIPNDNCQLANGCSYVTSWDLPDFSKYQLTCNLVTSLSWADNTHYPSAKAVADALSCAGSGDMMKSVYDPNNCAKDAFNYCNMYNQPTIPTVCNVLTSSCTAEALSAKQGCVLNSCVSAINWKIPSAATTTNQLADKDYVDNSINSVAAYYITKNAAGDQFATYAELANATTYYSWWVIRTPTRNDYAVVIDDETHNDETTRYSYQWSWWQYQYTINESPLTTAQLNALNSWITAAKVSSYDSAVSTIGWYWDIVSCNASCFATASQWWKADTALQPNNNISELNNDAWYITWVDWGSIGWTLSNQVDLQSALNAKANDNGVVHTTWAETIAWTKTFSTSPVVPDKTADATNTWTAIATEAQVYTVSQNLSSAISDAAFSASWSWDTTHAPSKNAIYGVLWDVETLLAAL